MKKQTEPISVIVNALANSLIFGILVMYVKRWTLTKRSRVWLPTTLSLYFYEATLGKLFETGIEYFIKVQSCRISHPRPR